jgi:hypothetical protein
MTKSARLFELLAPALRSRCSIGVSLLLRRRILQAHQQDQPRAANNEFCS